MPRCKDCGEEYTGRKEKHAEGHAVVTDTTSGTETNVADYGNEKADGEWEPTVNEPEMADFQFGGYTVQAPKGSTPLYSESHPILGLTKVVFQTAMSAGDGRPGDPAGQYVWRK
jgi:hypothetical protein